MTAFESAEDHYRAHRPGYGTAAFTSLEDRFALADGRVLDLGCGAGQLTVPLAERAAAVVAMDPNERMLDHARDRVREQGLENVTFRVGSDADLPDRDGTFRLAAMGRSFHWMRGRETLDDLRDLLEPGGGVALMTDENWFTRGRRDWQEAVHDLAAEYLDDLPAFTGPDVEYDDPWDDMLEERGYAAVETREFPLHREWCAGEIVGYVFSLSTCTPDTFGDAKAAFERDLRDLLTEYDQPLEQETTVEVITGRVRRSPEA